MKHLRLILDNVYVARMKESLNSKGKGCWKWGKILKLDEESEGATATSPGVKCRVPSFAQALQSSGGDFSGENCRRFEFQRKEIRGQTVISCSAQPPSTSLSDFLPPQRFSRSYFATGISLRNWKGVGLSRSLSIRYLRAPLIHRLHLCQNAFTPSFVSPLFNLGDRRRSCSAIAFRRNGRGAQKKRELALSSFISGRWWHWEGGNGE